NWSWAARCASGSAGSTRRSPAPEAFCGASASRGDARRARAYYDGGTATGEIHTMRKQALFGGAVGLAMLFGLSACTDPYDPGQRAIGGGLLGAATGAAIGGAAGGGHGAALGAAIGGATGAGAGGPTTPPPPPPPGHFP